MNTKGYELDLRVLVREVLDCGSPLPLPHDQPAMQQRAAAAQDANAFIKRS